MKIVYEKAQLGPTALKDAMTELLAAHPDGLKNVQIATALGIRSSHAGKQHDYLSYSILGLLMEDRIVVKNGSSVYKLTRLEPTK
ncbi:MAG: hypothetical protein ACYC6M_08830 [Terriglobales bacterium]